MPKKVRKWHPRTFEDRLLLKYWKKRHGMVVTEVPIGGEDGPGRWPTGCEIRRIDGVRLGRKGRMNLITSFSSAQDRFQALRPSSRVELIEVKRKLNRLVIGQVLAAQDMFERQYGVANAKLTIICEVSDPGLEWVCRRRGISVWSA